MGVLGRESWGGSLGVGVVGWKSWGGIFGLVVLGGSPGAVVLG